MHRKFTSQDEDRSFGKKIKEITAPYMAHFNAENATPEDGYRQFLNTAHILRSGSDVMRRQALQAIAQKYNVDLSIPLPQGGQQAAPAFQPQQVTQLVQAEIEKQRQTQEQARLKSEIEAFAADPANTYYEDVKPVMAGLLQSGAASSLKDAYDQALWARPDIRSTLTAQLNTDQETKRLADAKAKADAAKRASVSVSGAPGSLTPANGAVIERSLEDEIRANFRSAVSGRI